ncbi:MAG TPA: CHAD domain-containing protein [Puia sp.]|jgi:CHAD domain-containing protein|nr:CHAD domain-containing protein [Puia sp.]
MLTKKKQRRFLAEKERRWLQELVVFDESRDEKALHRLRLEVKKIRALVELVKVRSGKRAAGHVSGLKKMFRKAGVIRDAGSRVRFLEERNLLSEGHREGQARSIRMATEKFTAKIHQYRKKGKKASKRLQTEMHPIHAGRVLRWYAGEIIRTGVLLGGAGHELHQARKKIKTMLYVQKILPAPITERVKLNTDYLDALQEAIGQWHDAVVAMTDWAVPEGEHSVRRECLDKEHAVRILAEQFHLKVHVI